MTSSTLRLRPRNAPGRSLKKGITPSTVTFPGKGRAPSISYSDSSVGAAACLRCPDSPCMTYGLYEVALREFAAFPAEGSRDVCPTGALEWLPDSDSGPSIDAEECIGCALCVSRCPVGALHVGAEGVAILADTPTQQIRDERASLTVEQAVQERARFEAAAQEGPLVDETDGALERVYEGIRSVLGRGQPRLPTRMARNLLLGVGWHAAMRRLGDTNVRLDIAGGFDGRIIAVEVEFSDAVVDAPRNVLDDLAVLIARYGQDKSRVAALIVALALPNQRSEYWQVLEDISTVLGIKIGTLTVGALLLLLWSRESLEADVPFASASSPSIRRSVEQVLGRKVRITLGCESALESSK